MARTYANLITEARQLVNDAVEPLRDEDSVYITHVNRGLHEMSRIRPDALFDRFAGNALNVPVLIESGAPDYDENEVTLGAEFQPEMQFYGPLLAYIVGMIEIKEDEFSEDSRAVAMITAFRNALLAV